MNSPLGSDGAEASLSTGSKTAGYYSFSRDVREEAARCFSALLAEQQTKAARSLPCATCPQALLAAFLCFAQDSSSTKNNSLALSIQSASTMRLLLRLCKYFSLQYSWELNKKKASQSYRLQLQISSANTVFNDILDINNSINDSINDSINNRINIINKKNGINKDSGDNQGIIERTKLEKQCCRRSWLAGLFFMSGSVAQPSSCYRLELVLPHSVSAEAVARLWQEEGLHPSLSQRRGSAVVSLIRGEEVGQALSMIGATNARLQFEEILAIKETRNALHRRVNAESANIARSMRAAVMQVGYLRLLEEQGLIDTLAPDLRQVALLRLEHVDYSFSQIGELIDPPVTRASVGRRMKKIVEIASLLGEPSFDDYAHME